MTFKKEVKHSVVYETEAEDAPIRSVYVRKDWLVQQLHDFKQPVYVEVKSAKPTPSDGTQP